MKAFPFDVDFSPARQMADARPEQQLTYRVIAVSVTEAKEKAVRMLRLDGVTGVMCRRVREVSHMGERPAP